MRSLRLLMLLCVVPCCALAQPVTAPANSAPSRLFFDHDRSAIPPEWLSGADKRYPLTRFEVTGASHTSSGVGVRFDELQQVQTNAGFIAWALPYFPYGVRGFDERSLLLRGGDEFVDQRAADQTVRLLKNGRSPQRVPADFSEWVAAHRRRLPRPATSTYLWCDEHVSLRASPAHDAKVVSLAGFFELLGSPTGLQPRVPAVFSAGYMLRIGGYLTGDASHCRPATRREINRDWSGCGGISEEVEREVCPQPEPLPQQPRTQ